MTSLKSQEVRMKSPQMEEKKGSLVLTVTNPLNPNLDARFDELQIEDDSIDKKFESLR